MSTKHILPRSFYLRDDVVLMARELLGKVLLTRKKGLITSGIISETEAYKGIVDRASHSFGGRRTDRTEVMYAIGGTAYIYLCYGVHSLFNVVTNRKDIPDAVLIRGIIPLEGISIMEQRTGKKNSSGRFASGPGNVAKALGIHYSESGTDLTARRSVTGSLDIWIEDRGIPVDSDHVSATPMIGIHYAGEDALLPWRFLWKE
jgi:DNA-3-methyladenine glycosylase